MKYIAVLLLLFSNLFSQSKMDIIDNLIYQGEFSQAKIIIFDEISSNSNNLNYVYDLNFKLDLMKRILIDFNRTKADVISYFQKYYPNVDDKFLEELESEKKLEMKVIDGQKRYFRNAARNVFRKDKEMNAHRISIDGKDDRALDSFLLLITSDIIKEAEKTGKNYVLPKKLRVNYTLSVKPDAVEAGEIIRCWLPYPKENQLRQKNVKLLNVNSANYIVAPDSYDQRTLYMEKKAVKGEPTVFKYSFSYDAFAEYNFVDFEKEYSLPKDSDVFREYTQEVAPHIVFSPEIKELSSKIIGNETSLIKKVKLIYEWINYNIPWASAIEYSTIPAISSYCLTNMHGDCGIQTLLFITLCRYNGIPARWQSGWMLHPVEVNLHDWSEIYFEETGWIPVDQSFKLLDSPDPKIRYFFVGNTDQYHFIVNTNYSQPLFPAKIFPRSETVDFQRGEVEYRGGNLYFDKWTYNLELIEE